MKREPLPKRYWDRLAPYGLESLDPVRLVLLRFDQGEYIHRQGELLEYLMVVVEGRSKVCVATPDGKSLLLSFYSGRGLLGQVELLSGDLRASTTGQAITEFLCIGVPLVEFGEMLLENAVFLRRAGASLGRIVDRSCKNSALNLLQPLECRLCAYLLMTQAEGRLADKRTELAELLGVSYRHLLRTLERLCTDGTLEKQGHGYQIADPAAAAGWAEAFRYLDDCDSDR